jgi:hypothetical protein
VPREQEAVRDVVSSHQDRVEVVEREGSVGVGNRGGNVGADHVDAGGREGFGDHVADVVAKVLVVPVRHREHDDGAEGLLIDEARKTIENQTSQQKILNDLRSDSNPP